MDHKCSVLEGYIWSFAVTRFVLCSSDKGCNSPWHMWASIPVPWKLLLVVVVPGSYSTLSIAPTYTPHPHPSPLTPPTPHPPNPTPNPHMSTRASQITSLTIVYSTTFSRRRLIKKSKLCITGLCEGNSPVTGEFLAKRASNAENVSIWWRHHATVNCPLCGWGGHAPPVSVKYWPTMFAKLKLILNTLSYVQIEHVI